MMPPLGGPLPSGLPMQPNTAPQHSVQPQEVLQISSKCIEDALLRDETTPLTVEDVFAPGMQRYEKHEGTYDSRGFAAPPTSWGSRSSGSASFRFPDTSRRSSARGRASGRCCTCGLQTTDRRSTSASTRTSSQRRSCAPNPSSRRTLSWSSRPCPRFRSTPSAFAPTRGSSCKSCRRTRWRRTTRG